MASYAVLQWHPTPETSWQTLVESPSSVTENDIVSYNPNQ